MDVHLATASARAEASGHLLGMIIADRITDPPDLALPPAVQRILKAGLPFRISLLAKGLDSIPRLGRWTMGCGKVCAVLECLKSGCAGSQD